MRRLRVYSETAPFSALSSEAVVRALAERALELVVAVRPWDLPALGATAATLGEGGVTVSLWPMLGDDDGRFLHAGNVARIRELAFRALEACDRSGAAVSDVMLDLEPPVAALRDLEKGMVLPAMRGGLRSLRMGDRATGAASGLRVALEAAGVSVSAAVAPHVLWEGPSTSLGSRLLGTVGAGGFSSLDAMAYTTLAPTFTFGMLGRRSAIALLRVVARRAVAYGRLHGARVRVALGCIGTGALGDEPVYRSPDHLREDVRVATEAGVEALALLDLGGALARPPLAAWLNAFAPL